MGPTIFRYGPFLSYPNKTLEPSGNGPDTTKDVELQLRHQVLDIYS